MSVSIGRGRASMLRRSVSAEPERDRPGGLTMSSSSVTESPDSTSPSATPVKNIKLKKLTFQKPRLPKLRLSSHQISPDDNNNSNSPNSATAVTSPPVAESSINNGTGSKTPTSDHVHTNFLYNGERVLITSDGGCDLGTKALHRLQKSFKVSPNKTGETDGLHHITLVVGERKLVLTGLKSSTLMADVNSFLSGLGESLSASINASTETGSVSRTNANIISPIPYQPPKRSFDARTFPVVNMDHVASKSTFDFAPSPASTKDSVSTTVVPESAEDWGEEVAGQDVPTFQFGAQHLKCTTYSMNQTCNENRLVAPDGALSKGQLKKAIKKPMPVRARPVLDDRMRNLGLNKDVRLFDSENANSSTSQHRPITTLQQRSDIGEEDWGDGPSSPVQDIIIKPDVSVTENTNGSAALSTACIDSVTHSNDTEDWEDESISNKAPKSPACVSTNTRLKADSWQNNRINNILSGRQRTVPLRRSISAQQPAKLEKRVSFADEESFTPAKSKSTVQTPLATPKDDSAPVFRFGTPVAPPQTHFTFRSDSAVDPGDGYKQTFSRSLSTEDKAFTRPWDITKSGRYDVEANDWCSVRSRQNGKSRHINSSGEADAHDRRKSANDTPAESDWGTFRSGGGDDSPVEVFRPVVKCDSSDKKADPGLREEVWTEEKEPASQISSGSALNTDIVQNINSEPRTQSTLMPSINNDIAQTGTPGFNKEKTTQHYERGDTSSYLSDSKSWSRNDTHSSGFKAQSTYNPALSNGIAQNIITGFNRDMTTPHFERGDNSSYRPENRPWSRNDTNGGNELRRTQSQPFSTWNNSRENWEHAKGDNWRVRGFSLQENNKPDPPKPTIASRKPLYSRQQLLVLSKTGASRSLADDLFSQPMDLLIRRDIYVMPPPTSSTGYQLLRKFFTPSDLKTPNFEAILDLAALSAVYKGRRGSVDSTDGSSTDSISAQQTDVFS